MQSARIAVALMAAAWISLPACANRGATGHRTSSRTTPPPTRRPTPMARVAPRAAAAPSMSCFKRHPAAGFQEKLKALYGTDQRLARRSLYWFRRQHRKGLKAVPTLHCMHGEVSAPMKLIVFQALASTARHKTSPRLLAMLVKALGAPLRSKRQTAMNMLRYAGPELVPHLRRLLQKHRSLMTEPKTSAYNMQSYGLILARKHKELATELPHIIHLSTHSNIHIKLRSTRAMGSLGAFGSQADATAAVKRLQALLSHPRQVVVNTAIRALGEIGPRADRAIPALMKLFAQKTRRYGYTLPPALGKIGTQAAVTALLTALSRYPKYKALIIVSLGKMGPVARRAVAPLRKLYQDKSHSRSRYRLKIALHRIQPAWIDALGSKLTGTDANERRKAFRMINWLVPQSHRLFPTLTQLLTTHTEPRVRSKVVYHLGRYCQRSRDPKRPHCAKAIGLLLRTVQRDESAQVRANALQRLRYSRHSLKDKIPQLYQALRREKALSNRTRLMYIIGMQRTAYPPFRRLLKQLLRSGHAREKRAARQIFLRYLD